MSKTKTVVVLSGGLDSTTLLYHLLAEGHEVKALSVNYHQKHAKELGYAKNICELLDVEFRLVELQGLSSILSNNALTNEDIAIPTGAYKDGTIQVTRVANRNMIYLAAAIGWDADLKFDAVAFGAHAGEHTNYPDCKKSFADAMDNAAQVCDWNPIRVASPFIDWDKGQIVKRGLELGVPFEMTWSCYNGGEKPCGKCSTCVDRLEALAKVGKEDLVEYSIASRSQVRD